MGKYLYKNKTKMNIPIRAAAVLLCLSLVSIYFVSGLFARYTASDQGSNNARAAKFSIEGSGVFTQPIEASLIPGDTVDVDLIIQNNSEVAMEYTVTVSNETNNLPLEFNMEKKEASPTARGSGATFTERQIPGSHTDEYILHIDWKKQDDNVARMGMVDHVMVTVTAAQID